MSLTVCVYGVLASPSTRHVDDSGPANAVLTDRGSRFGFCCIVSITIDRSDVSVRLAEEEDSRA